MKMNSHRKILRVLFVGLPLIFFLSVSEMGLCESQKSITEIYIESVRLDEPGTSTEGTVREIFLSKQDWQPYIGYSYLHYNLQPNVVERRSPLLGLRWTAARFARVFAEYRHSSDNLNSGKTMDDPRLGVVLFYFTELAPITPSSSWFSDSYAEMTHMSRYSQDWMLTGWSKWGARERPHSQIFLDGFAEAFVQDTKDPALGRRAQELRYGVRMGVTSTHLTLSAQIFHRLTSWISAPDPRWRFIISLGGSF